MNNNFSHAKNAFQPFLFTLIFLFYFLFFHFSAQVYAGDQNQTQFSETLFSEYTQLAQQGDAEAQFSLALIYEEGIFHSRDPEKAVYWLTRAAQQNLPAACLYLGMRFEFGNGVSQDKQKAEKLYREAAGQGWAMAQYLLALLYLEEKKSADGRVTAAAWLQLADELGYPPAGEKYNEILQTLTKDEKVMLAEKYRYLKEQETGTTNGHEKNVPPARSGTNLNP